MIKYVIFTAALFMTIRTLEALVMSPTIARLQAESKIDPPDMWSLSIIWLIGESLLWSYFA